MSAEAGRNLAGTTEKQSLKNSATEGLAQAERYSNLLNNLESILQRIGIGSPSITEEATEKPHIPDELQWIINSTDKNLRASNNRLEDYINLIERELAS